MININITRPNWLCSDLFSAFIEYAFIYTWLFFESAQTETKIKQKASINKTNHPPALRLAFASFLREWFSGALQAGLKLHGFPASVSLCWMYRCTSTPVPHLPNCVALLFVLFSFVFLFIYLFTFCEAKDWRHVFAYGNYTL